MQLFRTGSVQYELLLGKGRGIAKLDTKMTAAFNAVYDLSVSNDLKMRDAAYVISIKRVAEAVKNRGWI